MASTSQVVVLAGVFFAAIFLHVLMMKEAFAVKKPAPKQASQAAKKVASAKAATEQKAATVAASPGVAGVSASALKPQQQGLAFSEIVQSLISYTPSREAQLAAAGAAGVGAGVVGADLLSEVKNAVREEVQSQKRMMDPSRDGPNASLSSRSNSLITPSTPSVASPGLNQGTWFRGPKSAYGVGQLTPPLNVVINSCDYASMQQDMPDMSKYVKKENVYGLA